MERDPRSTPVRRGCGHRFAIRTPAPALTSYLDGVYAALPVADERGHHHRYELTGPDEVGRWSAQLDAEPIGEPGTRAEALGLLLWRINRSVVGSSPDRIMLHAGGVRLDGVGIVLPGDMEVGKTTLTAGLLRAGADYLSDELVVLRDDGTLDGYAKALSLDPGSWPLFPELEPMLGNELSAWMPLQWQVSPDAFGVEVVSRTRPGVIAFPGYRPGATTTVTPLRGVQALQRLAACVFPNELPTVVMYQQLAEVLNRAAVYELIYGDLDQAVATVKARTDVASTPDGSDQPTAACGTSETSDPPKPEPLVDAAHRIPGSSHTVVSDEQSAIFAFPRPEVTFIEVHGEAVLHRASDDELLQLNEYGTAVWGLLARRPSIEELAIELAAATGKPPSEHREELDRFVHELVQLGVMTLEPLEPGSDRP
jgi:hypothetical protein